jgi:hypothetical protein
MSRRLAIDLCLVGFFATFFLRLGAFLAAFFLAAGFFFAVFFLAAFFLAAGFFFAAFFLLAVFFAAGFFREDAFLRDDFFAATFFLVTLRFFAVVFFRADVLLLATFFREAFLALLFLLADFFAGILTSCRSEKNAQLYIACIDMEARISRFLSAILGAGIGRPERRPGGWLTAPEAPF